MGTSLTPDLENSLAEGLVPDAPPHLDAGGLDRVCPVTELSGELGVKDVASRL